MISPDDDPVDVKNIISTLERNAGQGNFEILFSEDSEDEGWDDDDDPDEYLDEHFNLDEMTKVTTELNLSYNEVFRTQAEVKSLMDYPLSQNYEITWDSIENKYNLFDNQEQKREYIKFHKLITHDDAELIIPQIEKAIAKWPDKVLFFNLLQSAYAINDQLSKSNATIKEMFKLFPGYIFAKISYANMMIDAGDAELAIEVFQYKTDLNQLYPERNVFHFTEVTSYFATLCRYYTAIGNIDLADTYMHFLINNSMVGLSRQSVANLAMMELCTAKIAKLDAL